MKSNTLKKFSILGVVLVAASAVTAAVLPATKDNDDERIGAGKVVDTTSPAVAGEKTCVAGGSACDYQSATGTSDGNDTSDVATPTANNTTTR